MGKELKRVPLDFDWEIGMIWGGYKNPYYKKCSGCDHGYTTARERLEELVHLILIAGEDSKRQKNHPYFDAGCFHNLIPSIDMLELAEKLSGKECDSPFGFDAIARWHATDKIIESAGLDPRKWGVCPVCNGECIDLSVKELYDEWEKYDPPKGDGFQLWETTSEGSPVSPVFKTLDELCEWAESNARTFADFKALKEEWKEMLEKNFVCHTEGNMTFI